VPRAREGGVGEGCITDASFCNVFVCGGDGVLMCGCVYMWVFWQLCECYGNMCTYIYCVLFCVYYFFLLFRLSISILISFVCTGVRTVGARWRSG